MSKFGTTRLKREHVKSIVMEAAQKAAEALALQIEGETKVNIQQNGQIDTGFMLNSTYTIRKGGDSYDKTSKSGKYPAEKSGGERNVSKAPAIKLTSGALAGVAVGAEYAVFQEEKNSFLHKAGAKVGKSAQRFMEGEIKKALHD